jgi:cytochrome P450
MMQVRENNAFFRYFDQAKDYFKDKSAMFRGRVEFLRLVHDKVERRLEKGSDARPDFFGSIMKNQEVEGKGIIRDEMGSNAILFLAAGSETTATTLTGVTYLLLSNRKKYAALVKEIRGRFKSASEITFEEVNKLDYMIACLQEGLRCYPPVPTGFPHVVPSGGGHVSGHFIPEGTSVYVSQYATNHSTRNFSDPETYAPERWLGDKKYEDDKRETANPFSFGPRNCIGKK